MLPNRRVAHCGQRIMPVLLCVFACAACALKPPSQTDKIPALAATMSTQDDDATQGDWYLVDCLLPAPVRQLGAMQYLAPRRPAKLTASDCALRGGEFTAYDRANTETALAVWLPLAQQGDAKAQNYVGEIYEKGLSGQPDYPRAASWYRLAAEQGLARAQVNLGALLETGLGVEQNLLAAMEWYRKAAALDDQTQLIPQHLLSRLQQDLLQQQTIIAQLDAKQKAQAAKIAALDSDNAQQAAELAAATALYAQSVQERIQLEQHLGEMTLAYRRFSAMDSPRQSALPAPEPALYEGVAFGRFYALIIGNQDYHYLDRLQSPIADAKRLQTLLETRYQFSTQLLINASEKQILHALNQLGQTLTPEDNLLIFYAGHGEVAKVGASQKERGYWLPVDAEPGNITHWLNNSVISDHLDRIPAKRILLLADSCYAGFLGDEKSPYLLGLSEAGVSRATLESSLARRARIVISSGGVRPVLDGNKTSHSLFAGALISTLENNSQPLRDSQLFSKIALAVTQRAQSLAVLQRPEMRPVREAGHEGGSFYFVPGVEGKTGTTRLSGLDP